MIHLRSVSYSSSLPAGDGFPFTVPSLRALVSSALPELAFDAAVTFFVGENGSGKSTLLEALACAVGSITVGSESVSTDKSLTSVRDYARHMKLVWNKKTKKGFFMRSEDFFGYVKQQGRIKEEMLADLREIEDEYKGRSALAKGLASMPYARELADMGRRYGDGLDAYSHGESFFTLFRSRFVPNGLYLLDEPEAPLSPSRQLTLIALLKQMVDQGGQFIIATHSPILMAYPGAAIWSFDGGTLRRISYEETEHYTITRGFLNNPQSYLKHLLE